MNKDNYIKLRDEFCKELEPKRLKADIDAWNFYINSTEENLKKYENSEDEAHKLYQNEDLYKQFLSFQKFDFEDKHLNKELKELIRDFDDECNSGKLSKALRDKENQIAAKYNSYIAKIYDKPITKAELNRIIQTEKDTELRKEAYQARIRAGDLICDDLIDLIRMRNEFAKTKGYDNFFNYQLKEIYDVNPNELAKLLNDVYDNVKNISKQYQDKDKTDLSKIFKISTDELKAYHYGLLLDDNPAKDVNNALRDKEHVVEISINAYKKMGYDIKQMPIVLDLFPRVNKNTHGFCFDIQAGKDARILANLTKDTNSIDTLCHELGHCVYHLGISEDLPYLDQTASSPAMTEAIAMMMGDLMRKENFLKDIVSDVILEKYKAEHKKFELRFINRSMQIINFEQEMYNNPDQNLGKLWHDLKCLYNGRNEAEFIDNEWATIPHYLSHPAYYQNYFRADLMKAQIYDYLTGVLGSLTENKGTAAYLKENIFKYGKSIDENDLIEKLTGEKLSSKALCRSIL